MFTVEASRVRVSSVHVPHAPCGTATRDQVRHSIDLKTTWLGCLFKYVSDRQDESRLSFLCGDFNAVADGASVRDCLNRSPEEWETLGFIDFYRDSHGEGMAGFDFGTPYRQRTEYGVHDV